MFDLIKFIYNKYLGEYSYEYINYSGDGIYPIIKIYKFYSWENLIKGYLDFYIDNLGNYIISLVLEKAIYFIKLINENDNYIYILCSNINKIEINEFLEEENKDN